MQRLGAERLVLPKECLFATYSHKSASSVAWFLHCSSAHPVYAFSVQQVKWGFGFLDNFSVLWECCWKCWTTTHMCNATTGIIMRRAFMVLVLCRVKPYQGFSSVMHKYQVEPRSRLMWVEMPSRLLRLAGVRQSWRSASGWVCKAKYEGPRRWEAKMKALLWNNPRVPYLVETMSWLWKKSSLLYKLGRLGFIY